MKKIILSLVIIALVTTVINAQTAFQKVYSKLYSFNSVQQTTDGGYIVAGYDTAHACLLKLDANANTVWSKTFRGIDHMQFNSVYQTFDGGYIAAGNITPLNPPSYSKIYLARTDANGDTLWTRSFSGTWDCAYSVKQTPDSGFIVAGETGSYGTGNYNAYLIKTDANGNLLWTKTYASQQSYGCYHEIQNTSDGGFIIIGQGISPSPGFYNIFLIKTNSTGDTLWTRGFGCYNGMDDYTGTSIIQTSDGGYMALGYTSNSPTYGQTVMIKLNSTGDTTWTKTLYFEDFYTSNYNGSFNSIKQTPDGGYIIGGSSTYGDMITSAGDYSVLIKTDMNGDTLWTKKYGLDVQSYGSSLYINDLKLTNDGGYILAGYSYNFYGGYLLKTDASGNASCDAGYANFDYVNFPLSICKGAWLDSGGTANGIYTVAGTFDTAYINPCLHVPRICMVSVDSATQKNMIIWEKNIDTTSVDSYNIYRETTTSGVYSKIGNVSNSSLSIFIDYASNPAQKANRYKITTVDSYGIESYAKSAAHKTIHLSVNLGNPPQINLIWDKYEGFTYGTYRIWRGNSNSMNLIDSIQSTLTSYTDLAPPSGDSLYFVEVVNPGICTPTLYKNTYHSAISNIVNKNNPLGITEINDNIIIYIFPNPANDHFSLVISVNNLNAELRIFNVLGEEKYFSVIKNQKTDIDISGFAKGMYIIEVNSGNKISRQKIIKQ